MTRASEYLWFRVPGVLVMAVGIALSNDCLFWVGAASWATVMLCDFTDDHRQ